ncbi:TRAP transporter substrate-binding protein [Seonamhaeicola algicola]|uniref:TRAP transporter substrate-binding protein n=1 Tax=Seonamhaeicola algicola TaxID=1719036 RepID=A0A5C7ATY7_9FLAO|nr:TRAP transporter substrate-binding protein [Seonamhaeicola algicola]TXE11841.1 TRAP transporter substrate-binding protein [Seonamhaeicola algicola]
MAVLFMHCNNKNEPEFHLRASLLVNESHTWFQAFEYFSEILEKRTKGRIVLDNYHSEQLAKEIEAIRLIRAGVIDMTTTGSPLSNWVEILTFCELPFLLRDSTDMRVLINSSIGKRMEQEMINQIGLRPLGQFPGGPRHLTSNKPIKHPDDLQGLIVRVPNVPSFVTAWEALGAKPTPMAFSEVFTSLQQGTVEAQENGFAIIQAAGFYEVQKYVNKTAHVVSWTYPVIGEKQFQAFPEDLKTIFLEAVEDMVAYEHKLFLESQKKIVSELEAAGMTIIEVDKDAFGEAAREAIYKSLSPEMQRVYNDILKLRAQ